ncbi:flagellar hook assembly protein FlgD [Desulfonatronum thiodismutans]|uniref:flagellar hook assembly protein FlgD n=1 Tax=Desulfonatronum thiodismutans TaxID=159290 RepID=UPI0009FFC885|nr:flagellar hook capping FlgD N-terminal domain-containing protein [Desulfonatronum thiodismutans]
MSTSPYVTPHTSNLVGRAERDFAPPDPRTGDKSGLDRDAFLRLLTTQLAHQDPLNPLDDKEFVAQLAQFSSLEQLSNISESIESFKDSFARQETLNAVNFIGKKIQAEGRSISKDGDSVSSFTYSLPDIAEKLHMNIFDSFGNIVRTITLPERMPGEHEFVWDGRDHSGNPLPDGVYSIYMAAEGKNGEPLMISTKTSGVVSAVVSEDGQTFLRLQDGRRVNIMDVKEVVGTGATQSNALASELQNITGNLANLNGLFGGSSSTEDLLNSLTQ